MTRALTTPYGNALGLVCGDTPDGALDPAGGHALVVYDARNPAFRGDGKAEKQWGLAIAACRVPGLVRRLSWQRLMAAIARAPELAYLVNGAGRKYGLEPVPVGFGLDLTINIR